MILFRKYVTIGNMTKIYLIIFSIFVNVLNATNKKLMRYSVPKIRKSESMFPSKTEENRSISTPKKTEENRSMSTPKKLQKKNLETQERAEKEKKLLPLKMQNYFISSSKNC